MVTIGDHELTDEQAEMLVAIYEFLQNQDTPTPLTPSVRELMPMLGIPSTSMMRSRIIKAAKAGFLVHDKKWQRISRASTRLTYKGHHIAFTLFRRNELCGEPD